MSDSGSYIVEKEGKSVSSEIERLESQALLSWPKELALLKQTKLPAAGRVLDGGCGTGAISERLLEAFPEVYLTAMDTDPNMVSATKNRLGVFSKGQYNAISGSLYDLATEPAYDFVLLRYVLQHLSSPLAALRQVKKSLSINGSVAVVEIDSGLWGIVEPMAPGLDNVYYQYAKLQGERGGDRRIGRKLTRLLTKAGFVNIQQHLFSYSSHEYGLEPFLPQLHPDRYLPLLDLGLIRVDEYARLLVAYEHFINNPESQVIMVGFLVTGDQPNPQNS